MKLLAAVLLCLFLLMTLVASGCTNDGPCPKELVGVIKGIPIYQDQPGCEGV